MLESKDPIRPRYIVNIIARRILEVQAIVGGQSLPERRLLIRHLVGSSEVAVSRPSATSLQRYSNFRIFSRPTRHTLSQVRTKEDKPPSSIPLSPARCRKVETLTSLPC